MSDCGLKEKVDFSFIRYANCWEDPTLLLDAFDATPGGSFLSVASAGDNSFSLLVTNPKVVVAVDINKTQLYLTELKKIAIKHLNHNEVLSLLGFYDSAERLNIYSKIKPFLSEECRLYWNQHSEVVDFGIVHSGKFEKYFKLFVNRILPLIHSRKTVRKFFEPKNCLEQDRYYRNKWNNRRWKFLFNFFFSKTIMGKFGRDKRFFDNVEANVSKTIYKRAEKELIKPSSANNYILRYTLTGGYENLLPHYLQKDNFEIIKANIDKLQIREGYIQNELHSGNNFDYLNLSNIFEYLDDETFRNCASGIIKNLKPNAKIAYWNLLVNRRISETFPTEVSYKESVSKELSDRDMGFFYKCFILDEKL